MRNQEQSRQGTPQQEEGLPSDAGELGSPDVGMSDHNGPSDPDAKRSR